MANFDGELPEVKRRSAPERERPSPSRRVTPPPSSSARPAHSLGLLRGSLTICALALAMACGSAAPPAPLYPPYTREDVGLFDDSIDPRVLGVGYDVPLASPRTDGALFERAQIGDAVVRGRIDSVTIKGTEAAPRFELGVRVVESLAHANAAGAPLYGTGSDLVILVDRSSPSFGMVRGLQSRLSGHNAIVFARTYANESGEPRLHFHVVPDDPQVAAAVREAASMDRVPLTGDGGAPPARMPGH